ncbi:AAA domain-domain-containing protein [Catenaria anguillulae PL171]|uniref:AAA domain-domain-containing protein n=1 Tax=Catenaria anguillulae PL171 TaxID=765915 RepID=A0A1Y2I1Z6_9FUNG|nr:AAA domain-domain-containing protein [Catenaria anguillulae PL171]
MNPSSTSSIVRFGDVSVPAAPPATQPYRVPHVPPNQLALGSRQETLNQDVFLLGPPGSLRRTLAFKYAQVTGREIEYISFSRDVTEGDLKQRREIVGGTATYVNQACVRAAIEGRILILDNVQNCERNVLPLLNNLLENREMALEDGSFLVSPQRYQALTASANSSDSHQEAMRTRKLIPVHPRFFVIALGIPVPPYTGYPLDPPFRSRFQARWVPSDLASPDRALHWTRQLVQSMAPHQSDLQRMLAILAVLHSSTPSAAADSLLDARLPTCTADPLIVARLLSSGLSPMHVLAMVYPWATMSTTDTPTLNVLESVVRRFGLSWSLASQPIPTMPPAGGGDPAWIPTPTFSLALAKLHAAHAANLDMLLIGDKGVGKSHLIRHFAQQLDLPLTLVPIYRDMSARDLLQRRATTPKGDTIWEDAPLVEAMRLGHVCVLDGVDALAPGSLGTLERLISDRSAEVPSGQVYVSAERWARLSPEHRTAGYVDQIHPRFRLIAIARPQAPGGTQGKSWVTPEVAALMPTIVIPTLPQAEEMALVRALVPHASDRTLAVLTAVAGELATAHEDVGTLAQALTVRQLVKVTRHVTEYPKDDVHALVYRVTMAGFAPGEVRDQLDAVLGKHGIRVSAKTGLVDEAIELVERDGGTRLDIGGVCAPIKMNADPLLIPHTLFYENPRHLRVLRDVLKDWVRGDHILLIGNQGVGKNKLVDYLLFRLKRERQYMQLHRDTTVQSLTAVPVVRAGVLAYEDSPLVVAAREGHVLVVDEADKAPTHVTAILKALVEDGEMRLGDGRRIVRDPKRARIGFDVVMHPIENPDVPSEVQMLRQYAPKVDEKVLERLARAFAELRDKAQDGSIGYPYSTREIVNITRHLSQYPEEGLANVIHNVFAFDEVDADAKDTILASLKRHGIPVPSADGFQVQLSVITSLDPPRLLCEWSRHPDLDSAVTSATTPIELRGGWAIQSTPPTPLARVHARNNLFSEHVFTVQLPTDNPVLAATRSASLPLLLCLFTNPITLATIDLNTWSLSTLPLHEYFPLQRGFPALHVVHLERIGPVLVNGDDGSVLVIREGRNVWSTHLALDKGKKVVVSQAGDTSVLVGQIGSAQVFGVKVGDNPKLPSFAEMVTWTLPEPVLGLARSDAKVVVQGARGLYVVDVESGKVDVYRRREEDKGQSVVLTSAATAGPSLVGPTRNDQLVSIALHPDGASAHVLDALVNPFANVDPVAASLAASTAPTVGLVRPGTEFGTGNLDVLDLGTKSARRIPFQLSLPFTAKLKKDVIPGPHGVSEHVPAAISVCACPDGSVAVLDLQGTIRVFQVAIQSLKQDLADWQRVIGRDAPDSLDIQILGDDRNVSAETRAELGAANNQETRRGTGSGKGQGQASGEGEGSGEGSGAGGASVGLSPASNGGAARTSREALNIDELITNAKGEKGTQAAVAIRPEGSGAAAQGEISDAIREMHDKAVSERMGQLNMREYDMKAYLQYKESVTREIGALRQLIEATQRKQKERVWLAHQTTGELDERKLVDGLVGDSAIYKRRGDEDPTIGSLFDNPKRIIFSFDLSASMFKFNSHDSRLQRSVEVALLVMQAFKNFDHKLRYSIVGHSGDSAYIPFVSEDSYPKNEKEELAVLTKMAAHAQYCLSGDNTLGAIKACVKEVMQKESDEAFVVILSDANIAQYNIQPQDLAAALVADPRVHASIVFIGTLADQAERLRAAMPGKAHVCMDTKDLPLIMKRIFSGLMRSNL